MRCDADYLRAAAAREPIASLKLRSYELLALKPGSRCVDVGCGPGVDTVAMARIVGSSGRAIGVDRDPVLVAQADAHAREAGVADWTEHRVAPATELPFRDGELDACRCERVLQHLSRQDGLRTVSEMARVLRPGGRLVLIDTDWPSLSIHAASPALERRIAWLRQLMLANAYAARAMLELMRRESLLDISVEHVVAPLQYTDLNALIDPVLDYGTRSGTITQAERNGWSADLWRSHQGGYFVASLGMIMSAGTRRGGAC